jgi:bifunctional DNA-binding transcriptional regulator/antitoxin component of YhaV-PrlF toxin-antitoxin module
VARVTSKLQVTIPKAIADRYGIEPGMDVDWLAAGEAIRVVPPSAHTGAADRMRRLELFDAATARELARVRPQAGRRDARRGWTREDLYDRRAPG